MTFKNDSDNENDQNEQDTNDNVNQEDNNDNQEERGDRDESQLDDSDDNEPIEFVGRHEDIEIYLGIRQCQGDKSDSSTDEQQVSSGKNDKTVNFVGVKSINHRISHEKEISPDSSDFSDCEYETRNSKRSHKHPPRSQRKVEHIFGDFVRAREQLLKETNEVPQFNQAPWPPPKPEEKNTTEPLAFKMDHLTLATNNSLPIHRHKPTHLQAYQEASRNYHPSDQIPPTLVPPVPSSGPDSYYENARQVTFNPPTFDHYHAQGREPRVNGQDRRSFSTSSSERIKILEAENEMLKEMVKKYQKN